jgi:large subunit ribosomal protein L30
MAKAAAKTTGKTLIVKQTGGTTGNGPRMKETLLGLGLGRINATREVQDSPSIRGMLTKVRHLVTVEEKKG